MIVYPCGEFYTVLLMDCSEANRQVHQSVDDVLSYAGMQNIDI